MSHYIDTGDADQPNAVSFDDFIVSTSRIGCDISPAPASDAGPASMSDAGVDGGALNDGGSNDGGSNDASLGASEPAESSGCSIQARSPFGAGLFLFATAWLRLRSARRSSRNRP